MFENLIRFIIKIIAKMSESTAKVDASAKPAALAAQQDANSKESG